jgi:serine/threonine protein kinase
MPLKRLNQYKLTKLLWHGKNAEVYLAWDRKRKMQVVLKLLHESFSDQQQDEQMKQHFLEEGKKLASLDHPGIVQLIETHFYKGMRPYLVMPYASGGTLRKKHPRGTLFPEETIRS